ncbi:MAG: hypothetical protein WCI30_09785 [Clostridia bacterium]
MTIAALLCTIGIIIPMFSPIKIVLEPASFTLASHVAIFIAMFLSPSIAVTVALGTSLGFFLGGFPIVVVCRALSQVVFALIGAWYLQKHPSVLTRPGSTAVFALLIGLLHGMMEMLVVLPFYFSSMLSPAFYDSGFLRGIILLVGIGTVIHSIIDFALALLIWKPLKKATGR